MKIIKVEINLVEGDMDGECSCSDRPIIRALTAEILTEYEDGSVDRNEIGFCTRCYTTHYTPSEKAFNTGGWEEGDEWANYPKWMEDHHQERVKECKEDEEKFGPVEYADEESEDIPF